MRPLSFLIGFAARFSFGASALTPALCFPAPFGPQPASDPSLAHTPLMFRSLPQYWWAPASSSNLRFSTTPDTARQLRFCESTMLHMNIEALQVMRAYPTSTPAQRQQSRVRWAPPSSDTAVDQKDPFTLFISMLFSLFSVRELRVASLLALRLSLPLRPPLHLFPQLRITRISVPTSPILLPDSAPPMHPTRSAALARLSASVPVALRSVLLKCKIFISNCAQFYTSWKKN